MTQHKPVLLKEVLDFLDLKPGWIVVDGTFGGGGHAMEMLKVIGSNGQLIGLDQDLDVIQQRSSLLSAYPNLSLHHENFSNLEKSLKSLNIPQINAALLDIGFSSDQLAKGERGFSFDHNGPLDMRMNQRSQLKASDIINHYSEEDLAKIFWEYGQERYSRRFAHFIVKRRPFYETKDLVEAIEEALPEGLRFEKGSRPSWARRHPATKIFQALRIAVNQELDVLTEALPQFLKYLKIGGRLGVISFHSLEDRIVKQQFLSWEREGVVKRITKKAVQASREEQMNNPRSRSAKLRVVEKL